MNTSPFNDPRNAYLNAAVTTAGPAQLLVMLCERLVLDVQRALDALRAGAYDQTNRHLVHAQDIVVELRSTLRVDSWEGAPTLAAIYDFLHLSLVRANVTKDAALCEKSLAIITDLCLTWREAAEASARVA
ncbi:flagellar export chaperone FliS [Nocardioides sp.]|uniref:flagellar export chaperone FliS n=1 Tax=Nocardioides sp. TaxID=35761 RepID=UPI003510E6B4